ncbi:MAG TPA: signal peptidase I [Streptosporangiaceae bacterium]|nr:signal peptidase I [Streptosporangiaceae bacterium]
MMEEEQGGTFRSLPDTTRDDGVAGDKGEAQRDGWFHPDGHGEQLPLGSLAGPPLSDRQAGPSASGEGSSGANGGPEPAAGDGATGDGVASGQDGASGKAKPKKRGSFLRELPILIVIALGLALLIKTYAFQAYYIPSGSMEKTLDIGDKVLVNKIVYHLRAIHRGDIIVFNGAGSWDATAPPTPNPVTRFYHAIIGLFGAAPGQTDYIKRVIGVPGDHVKCCDPLGRVTVNGVPLSEKSYLYPENAPSETQFNIVVPSGHLWVMGDHRDVSDDSRDHIGYPGGGAVLENEVVGRAFWIVWPPSRWRVLPIPDTFQQRALIGAKTAASRPISESQLLSAPVVPASSTLPLAAGVIGAVPLTWAQRRMRRRIGRWFARRR